MKKKSLTILMILITSIGFAQKNNIKINLLPTAWSEIRLSYERLFREKQSLQFNLGMVVPNKLPNFIYDESIIEDYGGTTELQNQISGFSGSLAYRFYTSSSKVSPKGFYFSPYLKYNRYKIETSAEFNYEATPEEYSDLTPEQKQVATPSGGGYDLDVTGDFNANFSQFGIGASIGYQWLIANRFSIDWIL